MIHTIWAIVCVILAIIVWYKIAKLMYFRLYAMTWAAFLGVVVGMACWMFPAYGFIALLIITLIYGKGHRKKIAIIGIPLVIVIYLVNIHYLNQSNKVAAEQEKAQIKKQAAAAEANQKEQAQRQAQFDQQNVTDLVKQYFESVEDAVSNNVPNTVLPYVVTNSPLINQVAQETQSYSQQGREQDTLAINISKIKRVSDTEYTVITVHTYNIANKQDGTAIQKVSDNITFDVVNQDGKWLIKDAKITTSANPISVAPNTSSIPDYVQSTMDSYENGLINAVNDGNFNEVSSTLASGSQLYDSQQQLVTKLFNAGTKENLVNYHITSYNDNQNGTCSITTHEQIQITNSNGQTSTKDFDWVYSAQNIGGNSIELTNISAK